VTRFVFDSTALSHFARANRMDKLQLAVAGDEAVVPAEAASQEARDPTAPDVSQKHSRMIRTGGISCRIDRSELNSLYPVMVF
jgi:hypothetical protein